MNIEMRQTIERVIVRRLQRGASPESVIKWLNGLKCTWVLPEDQSVLDTFIASVSLRVNNWFQRRIVNIINILKFIGNIEGSV